MLHRKEIAIAIICYQHGHGFINTCRKVIAAELTIERDKSSLGIGHAPTAMGGSTSWHHAHLDTVVRLQPSTQAIKICFIQTDHRLKIEKDIDDV